MEDLDASFRKLKAEWLDLYDQLTRRDERLRKREERAREPAGDTNGEQPLEVGPQNVSSARLAALRARRAR